MNDLEEAYRIANAQQARAEKAEAEVERLRGKASRVDHAEANLEKLDEQYSAALAEVERAQATIIEMGKVIERLRAGGIGAIAEERKRQVDVKGWVAEHDDEHDSDDLAKAAACYLLSTYPTFVADMWPWMRRYWKPGNRRRELVKAGALVAAEIDRLDRAALGQEVRWRRKSRKMRGPSLAEHPRNATALEQEEK